MGPNIASFDRASPHMSEISSNSIHH